MLFDFSIVYREILVAIITIGDSYCNKSYRKSAINEVLWNHMNALTAEASGGQPTVAQ